MTMPMQRSDGDAPAPHALTLLGMSERGGRDETPLIEGEIPRDLHGSLYRNGPGLFERGDLRKPHLLDGDGLVQRLSFADGKVRYPHAFARPPKPASPSIRSTTSFMLSTRSAPPTTSILRRWQRSAKRASAIRRGNS